MRTRLFACVTVLRGDHHARQLFIRRFIGLVAVFVVSATVLPIVRSSTSQSRPNRGQAAKQTPPASNKPGSPGGPKYDCVGSLTEHQISDKERQHIEKAIDDALDMLRTSEPCRRMFSEKDPNYAIELLKRLRKDRVFVVSEDTPLTWRLSDDRQKLAIITRSSLADAGAGVVDLLGARSGEMLVPCIYINPKQFLVTGKPAENFALYGLEPSVQRAVAILHELGHVAGVLQFDGTPELRDKSAKNTDCIRKNCISCKQFDHCLGQSKGPVVINDTPGLQAGYCGWRFAREATPARMNR